MFKNLFKSKKETTAAKTEKAKVEKLDPKELSNVVGGGTAYTYVNGNKSAQDA